MLTPYLTSDVSTVFSLTHVIYYFIAIKVKDDRNGIGLELVNPKVASCM